MSGTLVHEVIRRLEVDGQVTHIPRAGAFVNTLDCSEFMEIYEMRVLLEGVAAHLAARAASELEFDALDVIPDDMLAADGDGAALFALNQQFHRAYIDAALRAREGDAAEAAMRAHVEQAQCTRLRMLCDTGILPDQKPEPL